MAETKPAEVPAAAPATEKPAEAAADKPAEAAAPVHHEHKVTRAEKKMKETLLKHEIKQLEKVSTVTMRKGQQMIWTFSEPEVYYVDNCYLVFGESQMQDAGSRAVEDLKTSAPTEQKPAEPAAKVQEDEGPVDATGLEENDIKMVMEQANVSRARAVAALRKSKGDMVSAVMELNL